MAAPQDHDYVIACSRLASQLSISIAAARRKVDTLAAREGVRDAAGRTLVAQRLLLEPQGVGRELSLLPILRLRLTSPLCTPETCDHSNKPLQLI